MKIRFILKFYKIFSNNSKKYFLSKKAKNCFKYNIFLIKLLKIILYNYLNIKINFIFMNNYIYLVKLIYKYLFSYFNVNIGN